MAQFRFVVGCSVRPERRRRANGFRRFPVVGSASLDPTYNLIVAFFLIVLTFSSPVFANPIDPTLVSGAANVSGLGTSEVTIHQNTPQAILNWQQFNIAAGETTRFIQPSVQSIALNRIFDANPSEIFGSLQANGSVILLNPNGVLFGPGSRVDVNGLIASSLNLTDGDFLSGNLHFEGISTAGPVQNAGTIQAGPGGYVYLFAPNVENRGIIRSPEGDISLAAGSSVYLSDRPDGRGFLVEVRAPEGSAANIGDLIADGGRIGLYGKAVDLQGLVQADGVRERNGKIELFAQEKMTIGEGSRILAAGGDQGVSDGGTITVFSDKAAGESRIEDGVAFDISGGVQGGNGGFLELSGARVVLDGKLTVEDRTGSGYSRGNVLIDPYDFRADDLFFQNMSLQSNFEVQADHDIDVGNADGSPLWVDLTFWPVPEGGEQTLRFTAGNDIRVTETYFFNYPETIYQGTGMEGSRWHIAAAAGNDIVLTGEQIYLEKEGSITLTAGRDIRLLNGTVPSYLRANGGGDIRLTAGRDIVAPSAMDPDRSIGIYSGIRLEGGLNNRPGELTLDAGRDLLGTTVGLQNVAPGFVLSNGHATVTVGGNVGSTGSYANMIIGSGEIDVTAGGDIYLGLVQDHGIAEGYEAIADPANIVRLTSLAGDVHLKPAAGVGTTDEIGWVRQYYPASFQAAAPAGSIFIESSLTFWPSLTGSLDFFARDDIQGTLTDGVISSIHLVPVDLHVALEEKPLTPQAITDEIRKSGIYGAPAQILPAHDPAPVRFRTETGDIRTIYLNLYSPAILKEVTIESGGDLKEFIAGISVPEGVQEVVSAGGNIDMTRPALTGLNIESGLHFYGNGHALVQAGGTLDLADSQGITLTLLNRATNDQDAGGLLEIAVGGDLEMTKSRIVTENGAAIDIHGLDGPESPVGGKVNVGTNDTAGFDSFGNYLGIMTIRGGSIDIDATGDVDVNKSRIATFGGGDIAIDSVQGNINAGSGGRDERVLFIIEQEVKDENENTIGTIYFRAEVPGSGIFTFHPDDPNPLPDYPAPPEPDLPDWADYEPKPDDLPAFQEPVYPPAPQLVLPPPPLEPVLPTRPEEPVWPEYPGKTAEMERLEAEIVKQTFLGHDTASLEAALTTASETQGKEYEALVNRMADDYKAAFDDYKTRSEQLIANYETEVERYPNHVNALIAAYEAVIVQYEQYVASIHAAAVERYKEDVLTPIYEAAAAEYNAKIQEAVQEAAVLYEQIKVEHNKDWKLGDIYLTSKAGDVVVPPAGIRGKTLTLTARKVVLEGGEIQGNVQLDIGEIIGDMGDIAGPIGGMVGKDLVMPIDLPPVTFPEISPIALPDLPEIKIPDLPEIPFPSTPMAPIPSGPSVSIPTISAPSGGGVAGLGGLSGSMGSLSSASVGGASVAAASVGEEAIQTARAETGVSNDAASGEGGSGKEKKKTRMLRLKRGVVIAVEIQEN